MSSSTLITIGKSEHKLEKAEKSEKTEKSEKSEKEKAEKEKAEKEKAEKEEQATPVIRVQSSPPQIESNKPRILHRVSSSPSMETPKNKPRPTPIIIPDEREEKLSIHSAPMIQMTSFMKSIPFVPVVPIPSKPFLIVHSRDIEDASIALLKEYGNVIRFDPRVYTNIRITALSFDYMLFDVRIKADRYYYNKIDKSVLYRYNIISLCYSFEITEDFHAQVGSINILTTLPDRQAFKDEYDKLLLLKKMRDPNSCLHLFGCCCE
jgi:hypothetical protein